MKQYTYLLSVFLMGLFGCEPDDICLPETPGTPELIVVFYNETEPDAKKEVPDLQVKGLDSENVFHNGTTDSIAIPLKANEFETAFLFTKTENAIIYEEPFSLTYDAYDTFISRACGYKTNFKNLNFDDSNPSVWIKNVEVITDTISNNYNIHVKILH